MNDALGFIHWHWKQGGGSLLSFVVVAAIVLTVGLFLCYREGKGGKS